MIFSDIMGELPFYQMKYLDIQKIQKLGGLGGLLQKIRLLNNEYHNPQKKINNINEFL